MLVGVELALSEGGTLLEGDVPGAVDVDVDADADAELEAPALLEGAAVIASDTPGDSVGDAKGNVTEVSLTDGKAAVDADGAALDGEAATEADKEADGVALSDGDVAAVGDKPGDGDDDADGEGKEVSLLVGETALDSDGDVVKDDDAESE